MTLRYKIMLAGALVLAGLLVLLYAASRVILLESYVRLEQHDVREHVRRAVNALQYDIENLTRFTNDWAAWDDSYEFARDHNEGYIRANLVDSTFTDNRLDIIVFVDGEGRMVYGQRFDEQQEAMVSVPESLLAHLGPGMPLRKAVEPGEQTSGLLRLPEGVLLVASLPIVTSNNEGPARGHLIMARLLDHEKIDSLARQVRLSLQAQPLQGASLPDDFRQARSALAGDGAIRVQHYGEDRIAGYRIIPDIAGKPALMLRVDVPRDIYYQGQHTLNYLATSLLIVGLLFGALFLILMERLVLSRLLHLGRQVAAVRAKGDPSSRVPDLGADELGTLSRQINDMLKALERSQAELRANDRQRQAAALLDSLPAYAYMKTTTGRYLAANSMFARLVGVRPQEIVGRSDDDLFPSAVAQRYREWEMAVLGSGEPQTWEEEIADGEPRIVASRVVPFRNDDGQIGGLIGIKFDISDRKATEAALSDEKERALITLGSIGDGVITTDIHGRVEYLNPVADLLTGWTIEEARGRPLDRVFCVVDELTRKPLANPVQRCLQEGRTINLDVEAVLFSADEQEFSVQTSASPVRNGAGDIVGAVLVFHDISELRRMTRQMAYQATHDALTGLPNRVEFERRLRQALDSAHTDDLRHAAFYLDLDQFKLVNDTCGHIAGDELLKQLAQPLRARLRESDLVARLGGDEFGVLLEGCSKDKAMEMATAMSRDISAFRYVWEDQRFEIGVSMGVVLIDGDSGVVADVLRAADSACYAAKEQGRNRIHLYHPDDAVLARRHGEMQWATRLQQALGEQQFCLYRQRIEPLNGAGITHFEILLRMIDSQGETVAPGIFLPAAERYGLMPALDRWVLNTTLQAMTGEGAQTSTVYTINISGQTLGDNEFLKFALWELDKFNVPPDRLCFEITETAAIANLTHAMRFMRAIKSRGHGFALDDFGSGLSSFAYLKHLPVDFLKIDGTFIKGMLLNPVDRALVSAVNDIAHTMGLKTVAEYVENQKLLELVRKLGIDYAQGFAIDRPTPFVECMALAEAKA